MRKQPQEVYDDLYKAVMHDEEFQDLEARRLVREVDFRALIRELTKEQREILTDYLGICAEQQVRAMEIACYLSAEDTVPQT